MLRRWIPTLAIVAAALAPSAALADEPVMATATATLSVLSGNVQRVPAGASLPQAATDGDNLQAGDRVVTGPGDRALVTFLDGSTVTVEPASDILVKQADVGVDANRSSIDIRINLGTVWARVVRLADPSSSFSLSSSTATAVVHDGLPGAQIQPDGTFKCWTFDGDMTVVSNQSTLALHAGQTTTVSAAPPAGIKQINFSASKLRVTTSSAVLPMLVMPGGTRVAGFVAPGVEVNQVFASFTDATDETYTIEVPGGEMGPFSLVLEGQRDDDFSVDIQGFASGQQIYAETLAGTIATGERLVSHIDQKLESGPSAALPTTALISSGSVTPLEPFDASLPGKIVLSPIEVDTLTATE